MKIPQDMIAGTRHQTKNFGELEVVEYVDAKKVHVRFIDTGYERVVQSKHLRNGYAKDILKPSLFGVGFIGSGGYSTQINGERSKAYTTWYSMLSRCYSKRTQKRQPTYVGCLVCPEWHNFQNFAEWFEDNYPTDGVDYQLDKDIKVKGNKVYSPETCLFVTSTENNIAANGKTYIFLTPKNKRKVIVKSVSEFCRRLGLSQGNMSAVTRGERKHHKGWTVYTGN